MRQRVVGSQTLSLHKLRVRSVESEFTKGQILHLRAIHRSAGTSAEVAIGLDMHDRKEQTMTIALWIIAVVETIRMVEQSIQLRLIAKDSGARDNAYAEFIKSLKMNDREFVHRMLEEFEQTEREGE